VILSSISETAMREQTNEAGLLCVSTAVSICDVGGM
jgi:hypothetical protein